MSVYSCLTDMVEICEGEFKSASSYLNTGLQQLVHILAAARFACVQLGSMHRLHSQHTQTHTITPQTHTDEEGSYSSLTGSLCANGSSSSKMRYRRLAADEDPEGEGETCNILVMEVGAVEI